MKISTLGRIASLGRQSGSLRITFLNVLVAGSILFAMAFSSIIETSFDS